MCNWLLVSTPVTGGVLLHISQLKKLQKKTVRRANALERTRTWWLLRVNSAAMYPFRKATECGSRSSLLRMQKAFGLSVRKRKRNMKQLLIYEDPFVINRETDKQLKIKAQLPGFSFAQEANSVPLMTSEFAQAARSYPIVFAGEGSEVSLPVALLGLSAAGNQFVDAAGEWERGAYVPAFIRRYPFALAEKSDASGDFSVCLDRKVVLGDADETGVRLFDDEGGNSPVLDRALEFLGRYQTAVSGTQVIMDQIKKYDLLVPKVINLTTGEQNTGLLTGFSIVDEVRLQQLEPAALAELMQTGALGLLYVHLMSLSNVEFLGERLGQAQSANGTDDLAFEAEKPSEKVSAKTAAKSKHAAKSDAATAV